MADYERRPRGNRQPFNNRKRRYRGETIFRGRESTGLTEWTDEDDYDRRPQRRRYEEPLSVTLRKQVLSIAESVQQTTPFSVRDFAN